MIRVTDRIHLDESELQESFIRASGPGGQNVNKVSSAVQLRFDARGSRSLPNDVAIRLQRLAGSRLDHNDHDRDGCHDETGAADGLHEANRGPDEEPEPNGPE